MNAKDGSSFPSWQYRSGNPMKGPDGEREVEGDSATRETENGKVKKMPRLGKRDSEILAPGGVRSGRILGLAQQIKTHIAYLTLMTQDFLSLGIDLARQ